MRVLASPSLGVEITDCRLADIDASTASAIKQQVWRDKLVVFRDQDLSEVECIEAARRLGEPQIYFQEHYRHPDHPEIFVSGKIERHGRTYGVSGTGRYWHTDYQFFAQPLPLTMVWPRELPSSRRETWYVDMARVWRDLPRDLRACFLGRRCIHEAKLRYKVQPWDIDKSIAEILEEFAKVTPAVTHPAVIRHPMTGEESLYVSEGFTTGIEGVPSDEAKEALSEVFRFSERKEHVHAHPWKAGDVLLWDNRALLHRASPAPDGQPSLSFRIGIYDGERFYQEEGS